MSETKLWLSGREAAKRLGVSLPLCYGLLAAGEIAARRLGSGRWYVSATELERYAAESARAEADQRKEQGGNL